jgi:hypothetical protein
MKDNLKIKRKERKRKENPLRTPILVLIGLLIAKRLSKARAVTSPPLKSIVYP